ncbi:MAG: nickel-dependent lactate racemase [Candidatus Latescibacteria bacterium]|nr:nickel-dependent lactate racemase [Candidatus Latescibacterota bacterium]
MQINLPYGNETLGLTIPDKNLLGILKPNQPQQRPEINPEHLRAQLRNFLAGSKRILVIVNDYTRPTPTADIISIIEPELKDLDFRFIVACGSHRGPNQTELSQIFGKHAQIYKDKILVHDAKDNSLLKFLGKSKRGTPVWLNQAVWQAEKIIAINSVEPHYFAGFTGGRKSFLPGVAGLESITANHKLSLQPASKTLSLDGNPVHEDMTEIAKMVPRDIFSIQIVINAEHELCSVRYGDIITSFMAAVSDAKQIFCVPAPQKADIVIALIQPPYDINFYQSQKAIENAKLALHDNGIMIVLSHCRDGIGDDEFIKIIASTNDLHQTLGKIDRHFILGYQKSAKLIQVIMRAQIWTVMPIDDAIVKSVFMHPFNNLTDALAEALKQKGKDAKIIILPDASLTVPLIK